MSRMIGVVAAKEFRAIFRDGRVVPGACVLLLLGVIALGTAATRFSSLARERSVAQALVAQQWTKQGEKNPHSAAHYGIYAFRPALPLSFFDPGVLSFEGVSIWLEAHKQNFAQGRPADDMTALARFGELSLGFIFQTLVPLGLILMGYAALSSERENGTLRQLLASGVTPGQLFVGKYLGLAAAGLILLAPLVVLCLLALVLATGSQWLTSALVLLVAYALYAGIILLLALIVSARSASSQSSLLTMLAFWAAVSFVLPRLAADLGRILHPTPTANEFFAGVDADQATGLDGESPAARVAKRRDALLQIYKVAKVEDLPINFQGVVFGVQDEISYAVYDKYFGLVHTAVDAQLGVFEAASALSPRMALALVSQEVSGTSLQHQRHFERDAEQFRRRLMALLNKDITMNSRTGQTNYRAGPELWRKTGEYVYQPESLAASLARCGAPLTVLVLWLLALLAAAVLTVRNLRVLAT